MAVGAIWSKKGTTFLPLTIQHLQSLYQIHNQTYSRDESPLYTYVIQYQNQHVHTTQKAPNESELTNNSQITRSLLWRSTITCACSK